MRMTEQRRHELVVGNRPQDRKLTQQEMAAGYHWCPEWDDLVIGPNDGQWGENRSRCCCGYEPNGGDR